MDAEADAALAGSDGAAGWPTPASSGRAGEPAGVAADADAGAAVPGGPEAAPSSGPAAGEDPAPVGEGQAPAFTGAAGDGGPLRHAGFRLLLGGQALSQLGFQFAGLAMPVIAVSMLHATEAQMGYLNAAEFAAFLLVGLLAGGWVDRMRKRRVMLVADSLRAVAVLAIPLLFLLGRLSIWQLYVVAGLLGVATVFFDVAYQSYIPILMPKPLVGSANGILEGTSQTARLGGPALAGGLLYLVSAPVLMVVNAIGFAVSAACLAFIIDDERPVPAEQRRNLLVEIREGVEFVARQPLLRTLVATTGLSNLGSTMVFTMTAILVLRNLGFDPVLLGALFTVGAVGGIVGSFASSRIADRLGEGPTLRASTLVSAVGLLAIPLAVSVPEVALPILAVGEVLFSAAVVVYNVVQVSARQKLCPPHLLGRMNASIRFVVWGIMPLAALAAGWLGNAIGAHATAWIGSGVQALGVLPLLLGRYGRLRELPTHPE